MFKAYYECLNSGLLLILLVKSKMEGKYKLAFNLNEAINENILISGCNRSGKSNLAFNIASVLQHYGQVLVVDSSGIWKRKSDIPLFFNIEYQNQPYPIMERQSIIYDTSMLRATEQKVFLNDLTDAVWYRNLKDSKTKTWLIIEESSNFCRNIRGELSENILRICTVGRNIGVRMVLLTVDLALLDPIFIRLSAQRMHGKLNIEQNSKRKFKSYYGNDWFRCATELDCGYFIWLSNDKLQIVKYPLFESKRKPQQYIPPQPTIYEDAWKPKRRKSWLEKLLAKVF